MSISNRFRIAAGAIAALLAVTIVRAQEPPGGGRGRGAAPAGQPAPPASIMGRTPVVDPAANDRGKVLWAANCIECHGTQARGSETGPNIIRTKTVNYDRYADRAGSVLGPFLKAGHPTQAGKPSASFTEAEVVDLANFLRQRVNDTMRGSELFTAGNVLVGDAKAGDAYFNGDGGCAACHNASTRSLAGIRSRIPSTVDLQQRMLFPMQQSGRGRGGRGRGAPGAPPAPNPNAVTVAVTPRSGPAVSGVLVERSDFYVTLRLTDGTIRVIPTDGAKVVTANPLQAHIDLLDRITDKQIHDVVAYLETLK
jgi:cytochrome c oxidase cbb3-type subunit III